jgi:hypothetical protein
MYIAINGYDVIDKGSMNDKLYRASLLSGMDVIGKRLVGTPPKVVQSSNSETYTENKTTIYLCLCGETIDPNTLAFVYIHELAHSRTPWWYWGHGNIFRRTFHELLQKAITLGLWSEVNYVKHPQHYCDITISSAIP